MSKYIVIVAVAVLVVAGVGFYLAVSPANRDGTEEPASHNNAAMDSLPNGSTEAGLPPYLDGANVGEVVDATGQDTVAIGIDDFIFDPTIVTVSRGTTVTWTNNGNMRHDVASHGSSPGQGLVSPLLATGETYSYTFDETGTYNYYCQPHPVQMKAIIEVIE